jgi:hypothetical protein
MSVRVRVRKGFPAPTSAWPRLTEPALRVGGRAHGKGRGRRKLGPGDLAASVYEPILLGVVDTRLLVGQLFLGD